MTIFILNDAAGIGSNDLDPLQAFVDLVIIANDDGIGLDDPVAGMQRVTYAPTLAGVPQTRLDALVNTVFTPDYGSGPQTVDVIVIAGLSGFTLDDGTSFANNGTALAPASSGLPGAPLNTTESCLVIYDTQQNICVARAGTDGDIDLPISNPVVLYHEFSHAFRIVNNNLLALTSECDPASPEENAAIVEENDLRTQIANRQSVTPELRDPNIHCGQVGCDSGCCIIATLASRSLSSREVQGLRAVRDHFVRSTEIGHDFFERFFRDYYSFSPQVCTLLAGERRLAEPLLEGFVQPLLIFWDLMIERSRGEMTPLDLGRAFVARHADRIGAEGRLAALHLVSRYWQAEGPGDDEAPAELLGLLRERAWPREHIQWALIVPVRIYARALAVYLAGGDAETIGRELAGGLEPWAAEFPISDLWARLSGEQAARELDMCRRVLLRSEDVEQRFLRRLAERYGDITAIRALLRGTPSQPGARP